MLRRLGTTLSGLLLLGGLGLAGSPVAHAATGEVAGQIGAVDPAAGERLAPYRDLIEPVTAIRSPLPADPPAALADAADGLAGGLGLTMDARPAIAKAGLPSEVAGRLANLVDAVRACSAITASRFAAVPHAALANLLALATAVPAGAGPQLRTCATRMRVTTGELELTLAALRPAAAAECVPLGLPSLDLWPVLRFESGCVDNTYPNDYLILVDAGGNDTYRNNVGSNLVDVNFAPAGSAVPGVRGTGPARGCQRAIPGLTAADCVPAAAVLLDLQGSDTYGVKEAVDHDAGCTNDPVVRRLMIGGAGFLGVGILRDAGGSDDTYTGKTGALGAGHIFGVGVLSDDGGADRYTAVRNSQGFALFGGFGLLRDEGGDDRYDYYMPAPIDPAAPNQTEGAGGVRDDEGEGLCDRIPRFTQGTANVLPNTVGLLVDDSGDDAYRGAFVNEFVGPFQTPSTRAGSLGFGNNQALGVFLDRAGVDTYQAEGEPVVSGVPRRANATVVPPGNDATGSGFGSGVFVDQ